MDTAANILIRGKVAEALDDLTAACYQYENALRVAEFFSQPSETGEIHFGIGNCTSRLGDPCRGFEAYLASARMFEAYGAPQGFPHRLSDALGEAGMLLVVFGRGISNDSSADEALLDQGLADAMLHASAILFGEDPPTRAGMTALHRKLTGLFVLAASASAASVLSSARRVLMEGIVAPFEDRYGMPVDSFSSMARLFAAIGEQEKPERVGVPTTECEIQTLVVEIHKSFDEGDRPMMIRWLGSYLRVNRRSKWAIEDGNRNILLQLVDSNHRRK